MLPSPGQFLVATPALVDPNFRRSVVYLVEHGEDGTLGFIVNRALETPLGELWEECPAALAGHRLAAEGGPVEPQKGLLLHQDADLPGTARMGHGLYIGGDIDRLAARWAAGPDAAGPRLLLGHSGWGPGQLDRELAEGAWILRPGDPALLISSAGRGGAKHGERLWERLASGRDGGNGLPEPSLN